MPRRRGGSGHQNGHRGRAVQIRQTGRGSRDTPPPAGTANTANTNAEVAGTVVIAGSTVPLAGVQVKWMATNGTERARRSRASGVELGVATSGPDGTFRIELSGTRASSEAFCLMQCGAPINSYLAAQDRSGLISKPVPLPADGRDITIEVEGDGTPGKAPLRTLAEYLSINRRLLLRDLVGEFRNPSPDSPTNDMQAGDRAAAVRALLQIVAQEDGKVAASLDALYLDSFIYTAGLAAGDLKTGVTRYLNLANALHDMVPGHVFPPLARTESALYRDYLRDVWVSSAQDMYRDSGALAGGPAPASVLEAQLDARFHQDFHVEDDTPRPAAKLLVPLLKSALVASSAREGFGVPAAAIPAQGGASDEDYLGTLIRLTKVTTRELRNRFRVGFDRIPGETTSLIQLNVEALLGLLADTFQSLEEPFPALPAVVQGKPLIFEPFVGRAPFFLEYEEWLARNDAFYPENVFDIRTAIAQLDDAYRAATKRYDAWHAPKFPFDSNFDDPGNDTARAAAWNEGVFPILDSLKDAVRKIDAQTYPAQQEFADIEGRIDDALSRYSRTIHQYPPPARSDRFYWYYSGGYWNDGADRLVSLADRSRMSATTTDELVKFEGFFDPPHLPFPELETDVKAIAKAHMLFFSMLQYFKAVLLPYLRATVNVATGDYAGAITNLAGLSGFAVGIAESASAPGYDNKDKPTPSPDFYTDKTLPYTTAVSPDYLDLPPFGGAGPAVLAPFEQRFFKLVQGRAMLDWADQLYRNDDPSSIRRARELYKGVVFMHVEDPGIAPFFGGDPPFPIPPGISPLTFKPDNPAKAGQVHRARLALYQIENGLNAYGYRDDMVPVLRYKPWKQAADLFAGSAKSAQNDFLQYMTRYEQAQIDLWQARDLVARSQAMVGIAGEQIAIAQAGVDKAQQQVKAVQDQIAAKQKEIADEDSFFSQASDFFGGIKDSLTSMVPLAQRVAADDSAASAASGSDLLGILEKSTSGGGAAAKDAAVETLGSGAAFAVGFGAFAYAGYTSMQSMADTYAKRADDLTSLETVALPAAQAQVRLKQRDVAIAQYGQQIAQADLDYANQLWRFQQDRFLNAEFWNRLTKFANQLMRSYIEFGARAAWQAERALAYEQNRDIRIIKMNYFPNALRGVTGPDQLQADLAALEATRLQGIRLTTPVKHTISLARDFPVAFAALKRTGGCRFRADEGALRSAYPGTYGHRIRAVTVAAHDPGGPPPRGILLNQGVSLAGADDAGAMRTLVRFPDALALSEFRLHDDLFVYGLPGETLLQFEGSGFTTEWELDFLASANPRGLRSLADVLLTLDMNALYSESLARATIAKPPAPANRAVAFSASVWDPKGLRSLRGPGASAEMTFDPARLALPAGEKARTVANVAVICVGSTEHKYAARLKASKAGKQASFMIENGVALSNAGPLQGLAAARPLNALVGLSLDQPFVLTIDRAAAVANELSKLFDVVLYLEYTATI